MAFRIRYRAPYDWHGMLEFLRARAIPGVESIDHGVYKRTIEIGGGCGFIKVKHLPAQDSLVVAIHFPAVTALQDIVNRVRRLFDLGADIETIDEHLSLDQSLRPWVAKQPGLRAPGAWDGGVVDVFPCCQPARVARRGEGAGRTHDTEAPRTAGRGMAAVASLRCATSMDCRCCSIVARHAATKCIHFE